MDTAPLNKIQFKTYNPILKQGEHIEGIPSELQVLLEQDEKAKDFFATLTNSYKKGYCDWVGSAK